LQPVPISPAQPKTDIPAQPKTVTPAQPQAVTPAPPQAVTPAQPKTEAPAAPEKTLPRKAEGASSAPAVSRPVISSAPSGPSSRRIAGQPLPMPLSDPELAPSGLPEPTAPQPGTANSPAPGNPIPQPETQAAVSPSSLTPGQPAFLPDLEAAPARVPAENAESELEPSAPANRPGVPLGTFGPQNPEPVRIALQPRELPPSVFGPNALGQGAAQPALDRLAQAPVPFAGWMRPEAVLVISGEQDGYLEPCGCSGKENKKGGLARRMSFLQTLRDRNWPVVPLDLGGQVLRFGTQTEIKFQRTIEGMLRMGYAAIGFGGRDLRLPAGDLASLVLDEKSAFCSANVGIFGLDSGITPKYRIVEQRGKKIGITAVLGRTAQKDLNNNEVAVAPAEEALVPVVAELKTKADVLVLLAYATPEESLALAKKFPEFQVVATAGGADEPPHEPTVVPGTKTLIVQVGHKGMYVSVVGFFDDPQNPWRYQRIRLDNSYAEAQPMMQLLAAYQDQLKTLGLEGLGVRTAPHPSGREFVGSATCGECHTKAHAVWSKTGHAHALETLVKLEPARHHDPECLSCHVVGWEPQRYFPFASGFRDMQTTPKLANNGCENCHGPGSAHVAAEMGTEQVAVAEVQQRRAAMRQTLDQAKQQCRACHDLDNSPAFDFPTYWERIAHPGKD